MHCCFIISNGYIDGFCTSENEVINEVEKGLFDRALRLCENKPNALSGYAYKLRADNLEWELVELPPVEPEPLTEEEALTRYANTLTGASDPDLISAAETLIEQRIKEEH